MKPGNKMIDISRLWDAIDRSVEHLSVTQAARLGGVGSGVALATAAGNWDFTTVLSWVQAGIGIIAGLLSLGLVILKWTQQRREMRDYMAKNTKEHKVFTTAQEVSRVDRKELHANHVEDVADMKALQARVGNLESDALSKEK